MPNQSLITIKYSNDDEMMEISNAGKCIFSGNNWDFQNDPDSIAQFLKDAGLNVEVVEVQEGELC